MPTQTSRPATVTYLVEIVREQATTVEIIDGEDNDAGWDAARSEALDRVEGGEALLWAMVGDPQIIDVSIRDEATA